MASQKDMPVLSIVHPICFGLDVHKRTVSACVTETQPDGTVQHHLLEFARFTDDLVRMRNWLLELDCPVVAMESTGVYWHPVHNVLEDLSKPMESTWSTGATWILRGCGPLIMPVPSSSHG